MSSEILGNGQCQVKVNTRANIKLIDLTSIHLPGKNKILFIDTIQTFDLFTHNYGYVEESNLHIKWASVANDYKGLGLSNCLFEARFLMAHFFDKEYVSWWDTEYNFNDFILFDELDLSKTKTNKSKPKSKKVISEESSNSISEESKHSENSEESDDSNHSNPKISTPNESKCRYFKALYPNSGKYCGRYTGVTPKQAASKAFTKLLQIKKREGSEIPTSMPIYLRESTRGSSRKVYGYEASQQKLSEPQQLIITDKETGTEKTIEYSYRNSTKKIYPPGI
jgi:hypothetical protein